MYKKQSNPSAITSQEMIAEALIILMKEFSYNDITVTDICKKADIVRKTFYRNFNIKEDVIHYILDKTLTYFLSQLDIDNIKISDIFYYVYNFITDNKLYLLMFYKNNLFYLVGKKIVVFIDETQLFNKLNHERIKKEHYKYLSSQIIATLISIVETWIEDDFSLSPLELAYLTENILYGRIYVSN